MTYPLLNKRVAILATDGFEEVELTGPKSALEEAGATVSIVSPNPESIQGMNHFEKGARIPVDLRLANANPRSFDALMLPGGLGNPDTLRTDALALEFVRAFYHAGKPIAAICHAAWILIDADIIEGRSLTSWPAIRSDVINAGGHWVNQEVVVDQGLITSRKPDDIPAFNASMIEQFAVTTRQAHFAHSP
jgi:protease I